MLQGDMLLFLGVVGACSRRYDVCGDDDGDDDDDDDGRRREATEAGSDLDSLVALAGSNSLVEEEEVPEKPEAIETRANSPIRRRRIEPAKVNSMNHPWIRVARVMAGSNDREESPEPEEARDDAPIATRPDSPDRRLFGRRYDVSGDDDDEAVASAGARDDPVPSRIYSAVRWIEPTKVNFKNHPWIRVAKVPAGSSYLAEGASREPEAADGSPIETRARSPNRGLVELAKVNSMNHLWIKVAKVMAGSSDLAEGASREPEAAADGSPIEARARSPNRRWVELAEVNSMNHSWIKVTKVMNDWGMISGSGDGGPTGKEGRTEEEEEEEEARGDLLERAKAAGGPKESETIASEEGLELEISPNEGPNLEIRVPDHGISGDDNSRNNIGKNVNSNNGDGDDDTADVRIIPETDAPTDDRGAPSSSIPASNDDDSGSRRAGDGEGARRGATPAEGSPSVADARVVVLPRRNEVVWREYVDADTGNRYYSNGSTTTWDRPADIAIRPAVAFGARASWRERVEPGSGCRYYSIGAIATWRRPADADIISASGSGSRSGSRPGMPPAPRNETVDDSGGGAASGAAGGSREDLDAPFASDGRPVEERPTADVDSAPRSGSRSRSRSGASESDQDLDEPFASDEMPDENEYEYENENEIEIEIEKEKAAVADVGPSLVLNRSQRKRLELFHKFRKGARGEGGSADAASAPSGRDSVGRPPSRGKASERADSTADGEEKSPEGGRIRGPRASVRWPSRGSASKRADSTASSDEKEPKGSVRGPRASIRWPSRDKASDRNNSTASKGEKDPKDPIQGPRASVRLPSRSRASSRSDSTNSNNEKDPGNQHQSQRASIRWPSRGKASSRLDSTNGKGDKEPKDPLQNPRASVRWPSLGSASNRAGSTASSDEKDPNDPIRGPRASIRWPSRSKASDRNNSTASNGKKDPKDPIQGQRASARLPSRSRTRNRSDSTNSNNEKDPKNQHQSQRASTRRPSRGKASDRADPTTDEGEKDPEDARPSRRASVRRLRRGRGRVPAWIFTSKTKANDAREGRSEDAGGARPATPDGSEIMTSGDVPEGKGSKDRIDEGGGDDPARPGGTDAAAVGVDPGGDASASGTRDPRASDGVSNGGDGDRSADAGGATAPGPAGGDSGGDASASGTDGAQLAEDEGNRADGGMDADEQGPEPPTARGNGAASARVDAEGNASGSGTPVDAGVQATSLVGPPAAAAPPGARKEEAGPASARGSETASLSVDSEGRVSILPNPDAGAVAVADADDDKTPDRSDPAAAATISTMEKDEDKRGARRRRWREYVDGGTGRSYYHDGATARWDRPASFRQKKERKRREWREYTEEGTGRRYYSDGAITTWDRPADFWQRVRGDA